MLGKTEVNNNAGASPLGLISETQADICCKFRRIEDLPKGTMKFDTLFRNFSTVGNRPFNMAFGVRFLSSSSEILA